MYFNVVLVRLGGLPILVLVANTEVNRKILAGLSQSLILGATLLGRQLFCLKTRNEQCVPYLLGYTVKYLRKDGITLLLEVFMGKGQVL